MAVGAAVLPNTYQAIIGAYQRAPTARHADDRLMQIVATRQRGKSVQVVDRAMAEDLPSDSSVDADVLSKSLLVCKAAAQGIVSAGRMVGSRINEEVQSVRGWAARRRQS